MIYKLGTTKAILFMPLKTTAIQINNHVRNNYQYACNTSWGYPKSGLVAPKAFSIWSN